MAANQTIERLSTALRDRYRIERELGRGGMATVYLAEDLRHHRKVAIKVFRDELTAMMGSQRFLREIEIAAGLTHPNILSVHDSGDAHGVLYYVMPFIAGESLKQRLEREGPLPVGVACRLLAEVTDAIAKAHRAGIVHRDIKPANILLSDGHALVMDFGVARALSVAGATDTTLTQAGMAVGTPDYMAPEQAAADPTVDHRADIYAIGAMAYEMLSGRPPFVSPLVQQVLAAQITQQPKPLSTFAPGVPVELERVVMRCLEKIPDDRYRTAEELQAQLELNSGASGGYAVPRSRRMTTTRIALWVGSAALVAIGIWRLIGGGNAHAIVAGKTTQITSDPGLDIEPAISPDGKHVAYATGTAGYLRIVVRPLDQEGRARLLTSGASTSEWAPRWNRDGSRILFLNRQGVFSVAAEGGPAQIEVAGAVQWAAWSHDGHQLGYVRGDSLLVHVRDGSVDRYVADSGDLHSCDWSHNDAWFACVEGNAVSVVPGRRLGNLAPSRIVVIPARGGKRYTVTDSLRSNLSPLWYPDGRLLYVSDREGPFAIYQQAIASDGSAKGAPTALSAAVASAQSITLSADASQLIYAKYEARANAWAIPIPNGPAVSIATATRLTNGTQYMESVSISLSGNWLVYDSNLSGSSNIYMEPVTGGDIRNLTNDTTQEFRGDLSPDDAELALTSFRGGSRDIFVMPLRGGPWQQVTATPQQETFPVWSPDGSALTFFLAPPNSPAVFVTKRDASGRWGTPVRRGAGLIAHWSPDGQFLCYRNDATGGIEIVGAYVGSPRAVYQPTPGSDEPSAESPLFSRDGQSLYFKSHDPRGIASIWSVPRGGGAPRQLVRFDDPARQSAGWELSTDGKRFYFTIDDSQSDLYQLALVKR